jgi:signal transduction histidine kinase
MNSLATRLFLAMALLAVLAVAAVTLLQRDAARVGFVELEDRVTLDDARDTTAALAAILEAGWDPEFGFAASEEDIRRFADLSPRHQGAAIFDLAGRLLVGVGLPPGAMEARVEEEFVHVVWRGEAGGHEMALRGGEPLHDPDGRTTALLLTIPALPTMADGERADRRGEILGRLDRRTLLALGLVIAVALIFSAFLARRIVAPVRTLAAAARALGRGDRTHRVPALGPGEIGALGAAFNDMAASLERSEHLRRQLVTDVAHELRTPLAALQGQIEAVQDGLMAPDAVTLSSLHEDVVHLGALVEDLQELALAEAGQQRLEMVELDLGDAVRAACRALGLDPESAPPPRLRLHLEAGLRLRADGRRLRQILHNLLENARAHAPRGTLTVTTARGADGTTAVLTVADDGPGIDPEHLPHLFERFYRADPARARGTSGAGRGGTGTGLGLAIARELVRLHGGTIRAIPPAERGDSSGAVFEVVLPLQGFD